MSPIVCVWYIEGHGLGIEVIVRMRLGCEGVGVASVRTQKLSKPILPCHTPISIWAPATSKPCGK